MDSEEARGQSGLLARSELIAEATTAQDFARMADLVRQYANFPLGTADASVIAVAERLGATHVATIRHRHFVPGAEDRAVGGVAAVCADPVGEPGLGLGAEGDLPGVGVDEDVRLPVVLDLQQEVVGLPQVSDLLVASAGVPMDRDYARQGRQARPGQYPAQARAPASEPIACSNRARARRCLKGSAFCGHRPKIMSDCQCDHSWYRQVRSRQAAE